LRENQHVLPDQYPNAINCFRTICSIRDIFYMYAAALDIKVPNLSIPA
jgi:hypothetical protein